jgi:hypothetical protein
LARPFVAGDQDFSVRRHAWFGKAEGAFELQFDSDDLLYSVIAVGVFRVNALRIGA